MHTMGHGIQQAAHIGQEVMQHATPVVQEIKHQWKDIDPTSYNQPSNTGDPLPTLSTTSTPRTDGDKSTISVPRLAKCTPFNNSNKSTIPPSSNSSTSGAISAKASRR